MGRGGAALIEGVRCLTQKLSLELGLLAQPVDQGGHRTAAVSRLHDIAQPDPVGLELLLARIAAQGNQPVARDRTANRDRSGRGSRLDRRLQHILPGLGALGGVALREVAKFMAEGGREFGFVVEHGEKSARHENIAGHGMCIDHRHIEHDKTVGARKRGAADQFLADTIDVGLQRGVGVGPAHFPFDRRRQDRQRPGGSGCLRTIPGGAGANSQEQRDQDRTAAKKH